MITLDERRRLKKMLPSGSGDVISKRLGISRKAVSNWFTGKSNSFRVEKAAFDLMIKINEDRQHRREASGLI